MNSVYVSNVPHSCDVPEITKLFMKFGNVLACEVMQDKENRYGLVTMDSETAAKKAVQHLHRKVINGRVIFMYTTPAKAFPARAANDYY